MVEGMSDDGESIPCNTCPVTIGKRNSPIANGSAWCRHCPFLQSAVPVQTTEDEVQTSPEGFAVSDRVIVERRLQATELLVRAALPRGEFLMFIEASKDSIAKFHAVTFSPVAVRSVVALVVGCVALSLAIALLLLIVFKY